MPALTPILADSEDFVKVIFGIIAFLIWGISALANMSKKQGKQNQAAMEAAMREQLEDARRRQAAHQSGELRSGQVPPPMMQRQRQRPGGPPAAPMRTLPPGPPPAYRQAPPGPAPAYRQAPPAPRPAYRPTAPPPPALKQRAPQQRAPQQRAPQREVQQAASRPGAQQPKQVQKRKPQRRPGQAPPIPLLPPARAVAAADTPGVYVSEIGQGSASSSPSRRQAAAGPMIRLTPQTLRQQFILTEILQPPLALRERPIDG